MSFYLLYYLVFGSCVGALTNACLDLFWNEHHHKGRTGNKKKLLSAFDWHCKHAYCPSLLVWFDNANGVNCCCKAIDIKSVNYELIKEVLLSQSWDLILSNDELKEIDVDSLNNDNGTFINSFVFSINYCKRGIK